MCGKLRYNSRMEERSRYMLSPFHRREVESKIKKIC